MKPQLEIKDLLLELDGEQFIQESDAYLESCSAEEAFRLGQIFYSGHIVPKDDKMALKCFLSAANDGHLKSMYFIVAMCSIGLGTDVDLPAVIKWYDKLSAKDPEHNIAIELGEEMKTTH